VIRRRWFDSIRRFLRRDSGKTTLEHAMLLALIAAVIFAAAGSLGSATSKKLQSAGAAFNHGPQRSTDAKGHDR
jgi:Flp pilus assembly pilin Flp